MSTLPAQPAPGRLCLSPDCEPALLDRFLKAEAMALWAVRSAQHQEVPPNVQVFLHRHEAEEAEHLNRFESMLGHASPERVRLPTVPRQWPALAVQLYGYESLGLEFARLLVILRPDLEGILKDEETHVAFFEREVRKLSSGPAAAADQAKLSARAWWRKLPKTVDRYLDGEALLPFKPRLTERILTAIEARFQGADLLNPMA